MLGAGAGLFFPAGLQAVAIFAGATRRGFAMGIYGVAFSIGLAVAALFGVLGASAGWRVPFWCAAGLAAAALVVTSRMSTEVPVRGTRWSMPWRAVLGLPTIVGTVGAILQYGVARVPRDVRGRRVGAVGGPGGGPARRRPDRVDRGQARRRCERRSHRAARQRRAYGLLLSLTGVLWVSLPAGIVTYGIAALFAGTVSSIGPVANVLAVERFGNNGLALGAYRCLQIGIGALAGVVIGNSPIGLRWTVLACVLVPLSLLWFCRPVRSADNAAHTPIAAP